MKENFTKIMCDSCEQEVIIVEGSGFPYADGWCYIHKFVGKIPTMEMKIGNFERKDKHFCSEECMIKWIGEVLKKTKGDGEKLVP